MTTGEFDCVCVCVCAEKSCKTCLSHAEIWTFQHDRNSMEIQEFL